MISAVYAITATIVFIILAYTIQANQQKVQHFLKNTFHLNLAAAQKFKQLDSTFKARALRGARARKLKNLRSLPLEL